MSKEDAKSFGDIDVLFETLSIDLNKQDLLETCRELERAKFLFCVYANNTIILSALTNVAIIYMENRFKNNFFDRAEKFSKIKNILF